jgi:hypothetical protein
VIILMVVGLSKHAEASAILFTDRTAFDAALNGDYELFTDFPPNDLSLVSVLIVGWTGGGLRILQDVSEIILGPSIGVNGTFSPENGGANFLPISMTQQITAIGFDLVDAWLQERQFPPPVPPRIPYDVQFSFRTEDGLNITTQLSAPSFFGAVLVDDVFSQLRLFTERPNCGSPCATGFAIDNLAVQSVPEPATALLVLAGAAVLLRRRRFTPREVRSHPRPSRIRYVGASVDIQNTALSLYLKKDK